MAHLFIRDPVSLFEEKLEQDLETETDHFEVFILGVWLLHLIHLSHDFGVIVT